LQRLGHIDLQAVRRGAADRLQLRLSCGRGANPFRRLDRVGGNAIDIAA
jgi:hypothetical protein